MRSVRSAHAELGQVTVTSRKRVIAILSVPALSLLLPGLAVEVASAGGTGQFTRVAVAVARFLLFYSGVFALVALSAAVAAGLLATGRIMLTPERRILAQALHRTFSLIGISALANHIMLEILASRARIVDGFIPFLASRSTFFMGLGTLSSDLFVLIIVTGVLRRRFIRGGRRMLWRGLHLTAYAAWPMGVLHGLLAGRSAKPYVDWSYGACLAAVALALIVRTVVQVRGRNATPSPLGPPPATHRPVPVDVSLAALEAPSDRPALAMPPWAPPPWSPPPWAQPAWSPPPSAPLRALPSPAPPGADPWRPRPPRRTGVRWADRGGVADTRTPPPAGPVL